MKKITITTGDADGIGFEVTAKALAQLGPQKQIQFYLWHSPKSSLKYRTLIGKRFKIISCKNFSEALKIDPDPGRIIEIVSSKNPALWFEESVKAAKNSKLQAIVTAPLSKKTIRASGLKDAGHTDIMRRILRPKKNILMAFMGEKFSLILLTDHIPIKKVASQITIRNLKTCIEAGNYFFKIQGKKGTLGVLGLNPHAGEIKNLGDEETRAIAPVIKWAKNRGYKISGPLIPDVCFQPQNLKNYSLFIAMYHDQGLIPFKIHHKQTHGIQVSLNLPFIRTSVDHGTAKDIFGMDKADPGSMLMALKKP